MVRKISYHPAALSVGLTVLLKTVVRPLTNGPAVKVVRAEGPILIVSVVKVGEVAMPPM